MEVALTPLEFFRRARRLHGRRTAVVDGARRYTYDEFGDRCDRWSAWLQSAGVRAGDRVAYLAPNTHAQLESFYAVPRVGAVLVPLNYRLIADDFRYLISHSGATVVCAHADYLATVDEIRKDIPAVRHFVALTGSAAGWLDYETLVADTPPAFTPATIDERDLLTINYTSGTTSKPKGVMITHRNAWMNSVGTLVHIPMSAADRYLWTLPMFHANGWTFTWTVTAAGGRHVCLPKVEPARVFELIASEAITMLCAAPTILIGLANAASSAPPEARRPVRVITAGAPPAATTIERLERDLGWSVIQVYGLTETAPFITICERQPEHDGLGASQQAIVKARQGVELITSGELKVVDQSGVEVPCDGHTLGEIVVRGNVVMAGYYQDPEATNRAMGDGWFKTGDAAIVHEDGYAEIRDRLKDVIISGGENISSVEVEGVLLRHPAVQEAAVVGMPDTRWGEAPHAFVVMRPGEVADPDEIKQFVRTHLAHFKAPHSVNFVSELPKTATGKIQKYVLRGNRAAIAHQ